MSILVEMFLKTMQLHATTATVTKIFRLTHTCCGNCNLYWPLDAVSALIRALNFNTSDLVHRNESGFLGWQLATGVERGVRTVIEIIRSSIYRAVKLPFKGYTVNIVSLYVDKNL